MVFYQNERLASEVQYIRLPGATYALCTLMHYTNQCCVSRMFNLGSGSKHFFILDPGSYMKSGMQTYFFIASYVLRSKVLVLGIRKKFIPDPGGKNHRILDPDPQL
jgi:hypothetical protein